MSTDFTQIILKGIISEKEDAAGSFMEVDLSTHRIRWSEVAIEISLINEAVY